jgi:inosose dehydratase
MAAMQEPREPRRSFLKEMVLAGGAGWMAARSTAARAAAAAQPLHLASNAYSWQVFYQREGKDFGASLDAGLKDVADSGIQGYEPGAGSAEDIRRLAPLLKQHRLELRSVYVNSTLHQADAADRSIEQILAIAREAKTVGTQIIVTNPNPIQWGGAENKNDAQLRAQAAALNRLGEALSQLGLTLAYHNHDIELRQAAREFHHMMLGTNPRYVGLCLDAHWIYRGAGNSSVALFDVLRLYAARVKELHLRQSDQGVWSETFGPGDLDYPALARELAQAKVQPHLVLEVAVEKGTPKTMSPFEAHRRSVAYARQVFGGLLGCGSKRL